MIELFGRDWDEIEALIMRDLMDEFALYADAYRLQVPVESLRAEVSRIESHSSEGPSTAASSVSPEALP